MLIALSKKIVYIVTISKIKNSLITFKLDLNSHTVIKYIL